MLDKNKIEFERLSLLLKSELDKIDGKKLSPITDNKIRIKEAKSLKLPGIDSDIINNLIENLKILYSENKIL